MSTSVRFALGQLLFSRNGTIGIDALRKLSTSTSRVSEKTALYDFHVKHNGKMVDFAGYELPVQYNDLSIVASHLHTRKNASIFDVSHMLQTYIRGKDSVECFESLCPADVKGLKTNSGTLTVFTTDKATIYDDLIVTKVSDDFLYIVSNAAMRIQDMQIMENAVKNFKSKGKDVSIEFLPTTERSLLAVQGPKAVGLLQSLVKDFDLSRLYFMETVETVVAGDIERCRITRCGYTGEDGVEISVASDRAAELTQKLLQTNPEFMKLAGLGARDSLRLEAGLCLYGTDIDQTTTPVEAGLSWLIAKRRRAEENFPGAKIINQQLKGQVEKRRVGFQMTSTSPAARHGVEIYANGQRVGTVTSGCPSPVLGKNIGMGYVNESFKSVNTEIELKIRNRSYPATISKMPFIKTGYYMLKK